MQGYQWCSKLGPEDLTMGTLTDAPREEIPTVVQNLRKQGKISEDVFGVFLSTNTDSSTNGEITFGCRLDQIHGNYSLYVVSLTRCWWQRQPSCLPSFRAPLHTIHSRPVGVHLSPVDPGGEKKRIGAHTINNGS